MSQFRTVLPAILAALIVALLIGFAWAWQTRLTRGLAAVVEPCATRAEASARAAAWAREYGGSIVPILGTGSMAPLIPAAAPGRDPRATEVAYAVTQLGAMFADVRSGRPCIYQPEWAKGGFVIHSATERTGNGWIMTGLANAQYEKWEPMTAAIFIGLPARVFTWPQ